MILLEVEFTVLRRIVVSLDTVAPLVALLCGLLFVKKSFRRTETKWLQGYLLCLFFFNGLGNLLSEVYDLSNHYIYHIANQLIFLLLTGFFSSLQILHKYKIYFLIVAVLFTLINLSSKIVLKNHNIFDSLGFGSCSGMFTLYSLCYYAALLHTQRGEALFEIPAFWFVTGILIYYASAFLFSFYTGITPYWAAII